MSRLFRILCAALLMTLGSAALAHTSGASFLSLRAVDADSVAAMFDFDLRDLNQLVHLDRNLDGALNWSEIQGAQDAIESAVLARIRLHGTGECRIAERQPISIANHGDGPFARIEVTYRCSNADSALWMDLSRWFQFDPGHRSLLEYTDSQGRTTQTLLARSSPEWREAESNGKRLQRFLKEGAVHLVTGYDHLAFLGVLLLALARRRGDDKPTPLRTMLRKALVVITAFTIAHSLTLALAASGTLLLPSKPVEVTIAASVLLAAILNLWRGAGSHGWKLAFGFGLVHGLGFASALAEMTRDSIDLLALAAFNLGIEAAQIAIALVAVPLLWMAFKGKLSERYGLPLASLSVAALAGFWIIGRLGI